MVASSICGVFQFPVPSPDLHGLLVLWFAL